jgi:predicted transcriptional regulator
MIHEQRQEQMAEIGSSEAVLRLTAQIVAAHVEHNTVQAEALPELIEKVYQTLRDVGQAPVETAKPVPAVPVKQSVKSDFIVCLEDGKKLKMLKRHLMTAYQMTPAQYRMRWGLPADYPMVAPNYAKVRSSLAKKIGLGRKPSDSPARAPAKRRGPKAAPRARRARAG